MEVTKLSYPCHPERRASKLAKREQVEGPREYFKLKCRLKAFSQNLPTFASFAPFAVNPYRFTSKLITAPAVTLCPAAGL